MSFPMFGLKILSRDLECEKGSVILLLTVVRVCFFWRGGGYWNHDIEDGPSSDIIPKVHRRLPLKEGSSLV